MRPDHLNGAGRLVRAIAVAALTAASLLLPATAAHAADVFIEVTPSTVQAGNQVNIRASCGDNNLSAATATSDAFGEVTLTPQDGFLVATVVIPANTPARNFRVKLTCPNGRTATTALMVINMTQPTRGPATGGGGTAGGGRGTLVLTGGLAALAVGAAVGIVALRRRRAGARA